MFGKRQPAMETVIGSGTFVSGELNSKGTVRIDGTLEGRVRADWIVVGQSGTVGGSITCRGVIVGGKTEGTIHANELVDIKEKGEVVGDIYTLRLAVSEGGTFEGHSYMNRTKEVERGGVLPFAHEK
jgi:cytoskeletal protein CcmA (bactofilin family)